MTSVPAIFPFDGAVPAAARLAGNIQGDAFSDLIESVGDCLVPAAPDKADALGVVAQPVQGAIAAIAVMLAAVTSMNASHKGGPAEVGEENSSPPEQASEGERQDTAPPASALPLSRILPAMPADPAAASAQPEMSEGAGSSTQGSSGDGTLAIKVVNSQTRLSFRGDFPRISPPAGKNGQPAEMPTPAPPALAAAPSAGFAPTEPVLRAVASLVQRDDRPDAMPNQAPASLEPASVVTGAASFIHSPAVPAPEAPVMRQDPAGFDPSFANQLDLARYGEWLDQLAGEIARAAGGSETLRFRLHPEALGQLHVEMSQGAAGTSIHLTTDTELARSIIAEAQPRLVAEARAQGVRIAETHVALGAGGQWSSPGQQGQQGAADGFLRTSGAGLPGDASGEEPAAERTSAGIEERYA